MTGDVLPGPETGASGIRAVSAARPDTVTPTEARGSAMERSKYLLTESQIPTTWYNIAADLPGPPLAPALNPETGQPLTRDDMTATMPEPIIDQELSTERDIEIPDPVRQLYAQW